METLDNNIGSIGQDLEMSTRELLKSAGKWGRFLAILGFVFCGLILIGGIIVISMTRGAEVALIALVYIGISLLYFFPTLFLYRFSEASIATASTGSYQDLHDAVLNLKKLLKFVGIMTIIVLGIYLLILIGALLFAGSMRF
jgi:hypothetical protein